MKRLFLLLALVGMIATSCEDSGIEEPSNPIEQPGNDTGNGDEGNEDENKTFITDADGICIVKAEGGKVVVAVTTNIEYDVVIPKEAQAWLSVADTRAELRNEKLTFTVAENYAEERSANVELVDSTGKSLQTIKFTQRAFEKVFESDGKGGYIVEAKGGKVVATVTTNIEYDVVIPKEAQAWLSVADTRAELRNEKLTFTVAENYAEERSANVELVDSAGKSLQTIKFTQRAFEKVFESDGDDSYVVEAEGGKVVVEVTTNIDYDVVIPDDAQAWLTIADTRAVRNEKLTFTVAENKTYEERRAVVTLLDGDKKELQIINIIQEPAIISCANNEIIYTTKYGYPIELSVTTGYGCNIVAHTYENGYGKIVFDNDVQTIPSSAFEDCNSITTITLPDTVTSIGRSAFSGCSSITSITIPDGVTSIGSDAFSGCIGELIVNCNIPSASYSNDYKGAFYNSKFTKVIVGDGVTSIGSYAFYDCDSLTSITIPDSVTSIGERAFGGCSSLTSITIPDGVTSIGQSAFSGCIGELIVNCNIPSASSYSSGPFYNSKFTKVTIGDGVTSIGSYAFYGCGSLKSVTIPDSVTSIGRSAFDGCSSLTSITIPDSVTTIGDYAFRDCSSLTSITIPDSVTTIGDYAFRDCSSLTSMTIGRGVTSIGSYAFRDCSSLTSITIPDGVTSIGQSAFYGCIGELIVNCNIPSALYSYDGAFYNSKFTKVTIGDGVTSIGSYAFYGCGSLKSVTIPDSVTSIGSYAFCDCSSLKSVTIPDSVTSIGRDAFSGCRGELIVNCNIPSSSSASYGAFYNSKFTKVIVGDGVTSIGSYAFCDCSSLKSVTIPDSLTSIGDCAFKSCSSLESVTIPNSVTSIGEGAFSGCSSLIGVYYNGDLSDWCNIDFYNGTSNPLCSGAKLYINNTEVIEVTKPSDISVIKDYAFYGYSSLASVTIPDSLTSIGGYAFYDCDSLTSITIPDSVTSIGERAFGGCSSLTSITIPDGVTSIGQSAFSGCIGELIVNCNIPSASYSNDDKGPFYNSKFTKVTIGDGVTTIGDYAFCDCSSLKSVTIPDSVTWIGVCAFGGCSSLTSVTIPDSVTSIRTSAFSGCSSLTSMTIGRGVTLIERYAFSGCTGELIVNCNIPDAVYYYYDYFGAFQNSKFTKVTIGDGVTSIGSRAFYECSSLTSVYCKPTTPPTGVSSAFYKNAANLKIYVPTESVDAYKSVWSKYASAIVGYDFENGVVVE